MNRRFRLVSIILIGVIASWALAVLLGRSGSTDDTPGSVVIAPNGVATAGPENALVGNTTAPPLDDPATERFFANAWDPAVAANSLIGSPEASASHVRLINERRDLAWAPEAEQLLRDRLSGVGETGAGSVETRCGSTICEVRMVASQSVGKDFAVGKKAVEAFMARVERLGRTRAGFRSDPTTHVTFSEDRPDKIGVLAYFEREPGF